MEDNTPQLTIDISPAAIKKRQYRVLLREKKRKCTFVSRYLELTHPVIYNEIMEKYKALSEQYPGRADLTKTYQFKKWEVELKNASKQQKRRLYVPHLPILDSIPTVTNERVEIIEESPQSPPQRSPHQPQEPPQQPQEPQSPPQRSPHQPQEPPHQPQEPPQTLYSGISLEEMEIAAQEIVKELQSDKELMDIVEGLDLPQGVWDNELSIPDYVLDDELQW